MWTEALAVGSQSFVDGMKHGIHHRQFLEPVAEGGAWVLQKEYEPVFGPENRAMMRSEASEPKQATDAKPLVMVRPR